MKTLSVKHQWLGESDLRLDASYHLSDGKQNRTKINNSPLGNWLLREVTNKIFYGGRSKRVYVNNEDAGLPFMGSSDMLKIDLSSLKLISKKLTQKINDLLLQEGWTLISRSGTIGNTTYVTSEFEGKAASEHIIRVVPNKKIKNGFLYSFLSSKYGYSLMTQGTFGAVIQHIEPEYLSNLPIPVFPDSKQQEIHDLIVEASRLRVEGNRLLREAIGLIESRVYESIGETKNIQFSSRNIQRINSFGCRLDAPFNCSIGRDIFDKIKSGANKSISDVAKVFHPILFGKKNLRGTPSKGNALYKSSSMMRLKPETDFWLSLRKVDSYSKLQVMEGWVLVSRTGTVGNVVRIGQAMHESFVDDHMIRVAPYDGYEGLVFCYLKSFYGQKLIEFQKYGSVQEVINSHAIGQIPIHKSLLEENLLGSINGIVNKSSENFDVAFKKESRAIDLVEKEIESWQKS